MESEHGNSEPELSEEQIEQLLIQAEEKLRSKQRSKTSKNGSVMIPRAPAQESTALPSPYVQFKDNVAHADPQKLLDVRDKALAKGIRKVEDPIAIRNKKQQEKKASAGSNWYNLPRTNVTPELKRDLQILRMRSVLDPKRHYKKDNKKPQVPEYSQLGTLVEGPADFFSARIPKKERKKTFAQDVLAGETQDHRFRKKYLEIQAAKTSGKKADYKARMAKKYGRRINR